MNEPRNIRYVDAWITAPVTIAALVVLDTEGNEIIRRDMSISLNPSFNLKMTVDLNFLGENA